MTNLDRYYWYDSQGLGGDVGATLVLADVLADKQHHGEITLAAGSHAVEVRTRITPSQVWLSIEPTGVPVCGGSTDLAGAVLGQEGFTLLAEIGSQRVHIHWIAN